MARIPNRTLTEEAVDSIDTGATVAARLRTALIHARETVQPAPASRAGARVAIDQVHARTAVHARQRLALVRIGLAAGFKQHAAQKQRMVSTTIQTQRTNQPDIPCDAGEADCTDARILIDLIDAGGTIAAGLRPTLVHIVLTTAAKHRSGQRKRRAAVDKERKQ